MTRRRLAQSSIPAKARVRARGRKGTRAGHLTYEEKLAALHRHASQLRGAKGLEEITKHTLDTMEFALGFDWAEILVVEDGQLRISGIRGGTTVVSVMSLNGPGIIVRAANTKSTIRTSDTRQDPTYVDCKGFDWNDSPTMLSELAVPVIVDSEVAAVLNIESAKLNAFNREDQTLLEILAFDLGSALKRLKHEERVMALHWHAQQLSSATSNEQITEYTLDAMQSGLGFDYANINFVEDNKLKTRGWRGEKNLVNPDLSLDGPGIIVMAANEKRSIRVADTRKEPSFVDPMGLDWNGPATMLSELAVPVIVDDETIAVLNVESIHCNSFTEQDQTLLETLAIHVASDFRRLRNLEKLRNSEQRFRGLLEHLPVGVYRSTPEGRILEANHAFAAILGYIEVNDLQQINVNDLYVSRTSRGEHLRNLRINGSDIAEFEAKRKDGRRIWVRDYAIATFNAMGELVHSDGIVTDITDRKNAETEIRKLTQFLESIIDNANVWLNVLDQNSNVLTWNKAAEEISGYSREDVVGHDKIWKWLYPDDQYRKEIIAKARRTIRNELREENVETTIRRKDGQNRTISWNTRAILDENNCTIGSVAIGRDVTEHSRMQKELERYSKHLEDLVEERTLSLKESEERLNTIIQASPEGIVVTDLKGAIVDCNQAVLRLCGYSSKAELVGRSTLELIAKKDQEIVSETLRRLPEGDPIMNRGYMLVSKDGREFPAEFSASTVKDVSGSPVAYVAVVKDLTEQIEIQARLRKAERMAVIGETAAMVGHDLRNPLQGISGAAYVLKQKLGSATDPQIPEMLGVIQTGLEYADKIVSELLDYSREIRLELSETSTKALTEAALLQVNIPVNITVRNLTYDMPTLLVDVMKTQRVFANLVGNAIDAMQKGGELTISSAETNGILEVKFTDTGAGIPESVMQNLWKPLKTTKSRGMGLGLAICKRIIEAHSGSIRVESTEGKGTVFTIRLPIRQESRAMIPA